METFTVAEANTNTDLVKKEFYKYINNTEFSDEIKESIKDMLGVVIPSGENDVNLDLLEVKNIMNHGGVAFSGIGEDEGENSVTKAIELAIRDSSLAYDLMHKIPGILIHFLIHPDLPVLQIAEAMEIINKNAHDEADIIWGTTTDKSVGEKYVKVTVLFTGFEKNSFDKMLVNNIEFRKKMDKDINICWEDPFSPEVVVDNKIDSNEYDNTADKVGLYQICGTHPLYGNDVLL